MQKKLGLVFMSAAMALLAATANADVIIDGQAIDATNITDISIDPITGDVIIDIDADWVVSLTQEPVETGGNLPVKINSFTVNDNSIDVGTTVTLAWSTENASSCSAKGGTAGWALITPTRPNGNKALTPTGVGNFTFTLECSDVDGGLASRSVTVAVTDPVVTEPPACGSSTLSGSTRSWNTVFGSGFPGPKSAQVLQQIPKRGYLAIQFNTGNAKDWGGLATIETTRNAGSRLGAISECPGNFNVKPECDYRWGISSGISWSTNDKTGSCKLKANTTYYLNLTFTDGKTTASDTCDRTSCYTEVRVSNPD